MLVFVDSSVPFAFQKRSILLKCKEETSIKFLGFV